MRTHPIIEMAELEAFERAAREGSFTRAADELGLTQPSISARIASLEKTLGCEMFERGGRHLKLTTAGKVFLPYARRILATMQDGMEAVERCASGRMGSLNIVAMNAQALYILPAPMARFRQLYPAVDLSIRLRAPDEIRDMLLDGEAVLGLTGAPMWAKGLHVHATFHEAVRPIVSSHHPLAQQQAGHGGKLAVTDLYDHTIYRITLSPNVTALVENIAEAARQGSGGAVIQIPATMAISLLIQGQGVAFLPENAVRKHIDDGRLVYLNITDIPPLIDEILLVSLKSRALDVPAKEFVRLLREMWRTMLVD